jgi:hypothetical protein
MINGSDIYIHLITIFLIFLFTILYSLNILISNKVSIYYKIISIIILFIIINLLFNLITKNMLYYRKFFCNLKKRKKNITKNDYIVLPYNDTNYALYND